MTAPRLALNSNFTDPYDYCFSRSGQAVFHRIWHAKEGRHEMGRREVFGWLEKFGIDTVPYGEVTELLRRIDAAELVVYVDEHLHCGDGKIKLPAKEALERYPNHLASVFMPPAGRCERHFQFGDRAFTMPFESRDDWRCQRGQSFSWSIPGSRFDLFPHVIPYPFFAIDFIPGTEIATDFGFCPGIKNDGLDVWMSPREMYQALCRAAGILIERGEVHGGPELGYGLSIL